jgi:nucleobase:cation symporter-1, NCS1 family
MVYPSENPPTPRAMPDSELNAKVAELQAQQGGLEAAMALIEDQTRLRQEDALALASWQLENQMRQASELKAEPELASPEPPAVEPKSALSTTQSVLQSSDLSPFPEQPTNPSSAPTDQIPAPAVPIENVDEIVASLNASYAQLAAEPESPSVEKPEELASEEPETSQGIETQALTEPEPVAVSGTLTETAPVDSKTQETVVITETIRPTERSAALIWSTLAVSTTPLVIVLTAMVVSAGASLAQSALLIAGTLFMVSLLFSIGAVAAKRGSSSLPIIARAGFGVWGNSIPAAIMLLIKLFWLAALIIVSSRIISPLIFNQPWFADFSSRFIFEPDFLASTLVVIPVLIIAAVISGFGGLTILRAQQLTSVISLLGLVAIAYFVFSQYSLSSLRQGTGVLAVDLLDLGLLIFAIFGFTVISQSGDYARKLPSDTPGSKVFFLSFVASFFVPLAVSILTLAWLFMADEGLASGLVSSTLPSVASTTPIWVFVLMTVSLGVSLIQLISQSNYSISASLFALGVKISGIWKQVIITLLALSTTLTAIYLVPVSLLLESIRQIFVIAAVLAAAWLGIVLADALIRRTGYHEVSLTREYGFYGKFNWVNLSGFVVAAGVGFGFVRSPGSAEGLEGVLAKLIEGLSEQLGLIQSASPLLGWSGYLGQLTPGFFEQAGSLTGILMSFGIALLVPVVIGIPRIRKQELSHIELEQRRLELKEFLDTVD